MPAANVQKPGWKGAGNCGALGSLVLICALHGVVLASFWSPSWLGFPHDDAVYLAAGKSLARGAGMTFPHLPGEPAQTKYPPLYSLLVSLLWRSGGELSGLLRSGYWLNLLCGSAFVAGCYVLMRQLGLGKRPALGLVAVVALHPAVVGLNVLLLSDPPFMALNTWTLAAAHWAGWGGGRAAGRGSERAAAGFLARWALVAALLSLAVLTRTVGSATITGVAGYGWFRRRSHGAVLAAAVGAAVFTAQTCCAWQHAPGNDVSGAARQIWLFYTSYAGFWELSVPDWRTFAAVALFNLREVLKEPAMECFLLPVGGFDGGLLQMAGVAVSVGVAKGVIGLARTRGWHPAHAALLALLPLVIGWNYPLASRFLLPFLPLFLAGAWWEFSRVMEDAAKIFRGRAPLADRVVCAVFVAAVAALPVYAAYRIAWRSPRTLARVVAQREAMAAEHGQAMEWVRANTRNGDRFISYQDARLYLETGRKAIRPMAFRTSALYLQDASILREDLEDMAGVVRAVSARYWLRAEDDFHLEVGEGQIRKAVDELLAETPLVFESSGGRVRIHDVSSVR